VHADGWITIIGFRLFDVALLAAWLFCFFRLTGDDVGPPGDVDGGPGDDPPGGPCEPVPGGGLALLSPGSVRPAGRVRPGDDRERPERRRRERPTREPEPVRTP
jgi:hypothetical protein